MLKTISKLAVAGALAFAAIAAAPVSYAENIGSKKCEECHRAEVRVWQDTHHFTSFKEAHRNKAARDIAEAAGGAKSMRRNETCTTCHYTEVGGKAESGPSCESCHGGASKWLDIHNNLGGPKVKTEDEPPAHKKKRLEDARKAGMIHSAMLFDIAENCNGCHTMANVNASTADKMIAAGHPINGDYEFVTYSQGEVRHRFYPPKVNENQEMTKAELAEAFLTGHAVGLVYASKALKETGNAKYKAAMEKRVADATKALNAVKGSVPAAGALLSSPTEANGRKFVAAIDGKDMSGAVGGMIPSARK